MVHRVGKAAAVTPICSPAVPWTYTSSASVSDVGIAGGPFVGATLTATYAYGDTEGLSDASTYQWFAVTKSAPFYIPTLTPISGATGKSFTPPQSEAVKVCVTAADAAGSGATVCSNTTNVDGIIWYAGDSQTGTATPELVTNGACVTLSSLGLAGDVKSLGRDRQC